MRLLHDILLKVREFVALGLVCCSGLIFLVGIGTFAYQTFQWLKFGNWQTVTVADAVEKGLPDPLTAWIIQPTDWIGVAQLVLYVLSSPLWIVSIVLWPALFYLTILTYSAFEDFLETLQLSTVVDESMKPVEEASGAELLRRIRNREGNE